MQITQLLHSDVHARQMCNGLANVVAAVLALPEKATHLWYHLFSPDELQGTQVTGFLVRHRKTIACIKLL